MSARPRHHPAAGRLQRLALALSDRPQAADGGELLQLISVRAGACSLDAVRGACLQAGAVRLRLLIANSLR
jgi:hypothetical protein